MTFEFDDVPEAKIAVRTCMRPVLVDSCVELLVLLVDTHVPLQL
jgi:hypothetical protein